MGALASLSHGELNVVDAASGTVTALPEATAALDGGDEILGIRGFSPQGDRILYRHGRCRRQCGPLEHRRQRLRHPPCRRRDVGGQLVLAHSG